MKSLFLLLSIAALFFSCKKEDAPAASSSYSLISRNPTEIRTAINGTWQIKREIQLTTWNSGSSVDEKTWPNNTGHIARFLPNDTLNMFKADSTQVYVYAKAALTQIPNPIPGNNTEQVYGYLIPNGNTWIMREVKNDTLVFYDLYPAHIMVTYFATRKN